MQKSRSILFFLLGILMAGSIGAAAFTYLAYLDSEQQLEKLHRSFAELEYENECLRNMSGMLTIKDRSKVHIIDSSDGATGWRSHDYRRERTWKVWVPDGNSLELHLATGSYLDGDYPERSPKPPIVLTPGEHNIRMTMMKFPQMHNWHLQLATVDDKISLNAKWLRWKDATVPSTVRFVPKTEVFDGKSLVPLWRHQVQEQSTRQQDGFVLWLEPSKPAKKVATIIPKASLAAR